jgi:hypothetical protein
LPGEKTHCSENERNAQRKSETLSARTKRPEKKRRARRNRGAGGAGREKRDERRGENESLVLSAARDLKNP